LDPEGKKLEELNSTKGDETNSVFASLPLAIKWLRENAQQNRSIRFQVCSSIEKCRNNVFPLYFDLLTKF